MLAITLAAFCRRRFHAMPAMSVTNASTLTITMGHNEAELRSSEPRLASASTAVVVVVTVAVDVDGRLCAVGLKLGLCRSCAYPLRVLPRILLRTSFFDRVPDQLGFVFRVDPQ